ncbi:tripartite tricarboxylate transporter TctB family protein [Paenibacillus albicereus]|uniref:Tripartite tricarboxylate transporter TctB family protein n=1 Tax=Paenibacillus albicereus TaxID=2726185 RepID=A0A6H2H3W4_9BACL|nr:tripartite tricarboxylate transporter TctB family protein [Paenibacillus albicereus]QJC54038.1 tripartite tricarboxylate transporter TctB family protein [Paenibacillus albicereus]
MNRIFDRYAGVAFLLVGAAFVWESRKIGESSYGSNVGPDIFPMGLGILLILLSSRLLYETFRGRAKDDAQEGKEKLDYKRFAIIVGAAILYAYFLEDIGYVFGTFLFLLLGFQVIERGRWLVSLLVSALFSVGVYYVFVQVLEGTLPGFPSWMNLG